MRILFAFLLLLVPVWSPGDVHADGQSGYSLSAPLIPSDTEQRILVIAELAADHVPFARREAILDSILSSPMDQQTTTALVDSLQSLMTSYTVDVPNAKRQSKQLRITKVAPTRHERNDPVVRESHTGTLPQSVDTAASKKQKERLLLLAKAIRNIDKILLSCDDQDRILAVASGVAVAFEHPGGVPGFALSQLVKCAAPKDLRALHALRIMDRFPVIRYDGYLDVLSTDHAHLLRDMVRTKLGRSGQAFPYEPLHVLCQLGDHALIDELEAYVAEIQDKKRGPGKYVRQRLVEMHMARDPHWALEFLNEKTDLLNMIEPVLAKAKASGIPLAQLAEAISAQITAWSEKGSMQWSIKRAGIHAGVLTEQDFPEVVEKKWYEDLTPAEVQELEKIIGQSLTPESGS